MKAKVLYLSMVLVLLSSLGIAAMPTVSAQAPTPSWSSEIQRDRAVFQCVPEALAQSTCPSDLEIEAFAGGFAPWTPLYMIQIYPNGSAVYSRVEPENRSTATWTHISSFNLTVDQMNVIWDAITVNNFFSLEQNYSTPAADGSFAVMNITANGVTHTVITQNTKVAAFDSIVITINDATPGDLDLFYYAIHPQADPPSTSTVMGLATSFTEVTIKDCKITVKIFIELYGPGANAAFAAKVEKDIEDLWNKGTLHVQCVCTCPIKEPGCSVTFDAVVKIGNGTATAGYHQIRVVNDATATYPFSFVWTPLPTPDGKTKGTGDWMDNAVAKTYAHEAGHLMGEVDQYDRFRKDGTTPVPKNGPFKPDDISKPLPGHGNDIMGSIYNCTEVPTQDSIDHIVSAGGVTCPCECCPPFTQRFCIEQSNGVSASGTVTFTKDGNVIGGPYNVHCPHAYGYASCYAFDLPQKPNDISWNITINWTGACGDPTCNADQWTGTNQPWPATYTKTHSHSPEGWGVSIWEPAIGERNLPDVTYPGDTFDVFVNFTVPADDFNAIGLTDLAPAGWEVAVDAAWCTPNADAAKATGNKTEIMWFGPYAKDTNFSAMYKVTVPDDAEPGINLFPYNDCSNAWLEYYFGEQGPYTSCVIGEYEMTVTVTIDVMRNLPADALDLDAEYPGDTFNVWVNFTAPVDNFASIGLTDLAPAGWAVQTNTAWCSPAASWTKGEGNKAEYAWSGPFAEGQEFSAMYEVTIPATANNGINDWPNCNISEAWVEYWFGPKGPYESCITGDWQKIVTVPGKVWGETRDVNADLLTTTLVVLNEEPPESLDEPEDSDSSTAPDAIYKDDVDDTGFYWLEASKYCYFTLNTSAMPGTRNPWHDDYINFTDTALLAAGYPLDFEGDYGLVPKACTMSYAMESVNHWLFIPADALAVPHPEWQLSNWKAMESVHSWQFPCGCNA